jgi:choline-sulfatase
MTQTDTVQERPNILLIMSDEHDPSITGCHGHPTIASPHLDRLACEGAVFDNAYTNCPICAPARVSFMTGLYVHQHGCWDNAAPFRSGLPTMGSYLEAEGYETVLCGRTHFVGPNRLHGWGRRLLDDLELWHDPRMVAPDRSPEAQRRSDSHVTNCGPGEHHQNEYDEYVTDLAVRFLQNAARNPAGRPWALYCGTINPHFPLVAPARYFQMYYPDRVRLPSTLHEPLEAQHPAIRQLRHWLRNEEPYDEKLVRTALAGYYGLISFTDDLIGRMLEVIDGSPLRDNTVVIYTSDHGEMGGHHGFWQKQCFYEPSVRIPLIVRAPGVPGGRRIREHASLVDILPTVLDLAHAALPDGLAGESLAGLLHGTGRPDRPVFSEYHTLGSENAGYMLKQDNLKYVHYVGYEPQLFDVIQDPDEIHDLAGAPALRQQQQSLHAKLLEVVDPIEVDRQAKANQAIQGIRRAFLKQ